MAAVRFHLRMYTCDKCLRPKALWVPLPAPDKVKQVHGACEKCNEGTGEFTRRVRT